MVARSGQQSNCQAFVNLFQSNALYESPVGGTPAVGTAAILQACNDWNKLLGPQGNVSGQLQRCFFLAESDSQTHCCIDVLAGLVPGESPSNALTTSGVVM